MSAEALIRSMPSGRLAAARAVLKAEAERRSKLMTERARAADLWRPTPQQWENDRTALNPADIVRPKLWDLSPLQQSFDMTVPPTDRPPAPTNTSPPLIQQFTGLEVGDQVALSVGTWTGGPTYARQWKRDGAPIPGATLPAYTLAAEDVGAMIGGTVTGTNAGGSASAEADPVGPIVEAAPPALAKPRK
jgi:hypothetical protein